MQKRSCVEKNTIKIYTDWNQETGTGEKVEYRWGNLVQQQSFGTVAIRVDAGWNTEKGSREFAWRLAGEMQRI